MVGSGTDVLQTDQHEQGSGPPGHAPSSVSGSSRTESEPLTLLAARKAKELRNHLHAPARPWTMRGNPVRRKVLNRICDYLQRLQWLLDESQAKRGADEEAQEWIRAAVERIGEVKDLDLHAAWEIEDDLRIALLRVCDDSYLYLLLQKEQNQNRKAAGPDADPHAWSRYFAEADLTKLIDGFDKQRGTFQSDGARREAVLKLEAIFDAERHDFRHDRAAAAQLGSYLDKLALLVLGLDLIIASIMWRPWKDSLVPGEVLLVVPLAGALGSVLSLMLRFRDRIRRITELMDTWALWRAQLVLGSTMALLVYFIVRTGFITIAGLDPGTNDLVRLCILGFVSGFSEPFFLRAIEKITTAFAK